MRKNLPAACIITMICLCTSAFGQTNEMVSNKDSHEKPTAKTYLDLLLNVVSTNLNYGSANSNLNNYKKSVLGAQAGLSFQAGITPDFSLVPELYFMMKGGKLKAGNPLTSTETTLRFYTVELPVLARFHIGKFYVNAGPSVAYNIGGTNKIENDSKSLSFNHSNEGFRRVDGGIQMGGGFMFPLKQKRVAVDIRYCYGLTNISYGREIYNRSLLVSIHFSKPWKTNPLGKNRHS